MPDPAIKLRQAWDHMSGGRWEQARAVLLRHAAESPSEPRGALFLSVTLASLGQLEPALYHARRAARLAPAQLDTRLNLANALLLTGHTDEAEALLRALSADHPDRAEPRAALGEILRARGDLSGATAQFRAALRVRPGDPGLTATCASMLLLTGHAREAGAMAAGASLMNPAHAEIARVAASALNYDDAATPERTLEAHRRFGRAVAAGLPPPAPPVNNPDPERRLRVGILSHDLRRHSVASFLEPLLAHASGPDLTCYSTHPLEDEVSGRLRSLVPAWRQVAALSADALADRIRADRIDILIETSGLTQGHRLDVLARRPAPLQATFLGYPNTTGLDSVDARIVDSLTDPPGAERWCAERLIRLDPCFLCFQPPRSAPDPGPPPSRDAGHVTFVSFNAATKISPSAVRLWSRVLEAVPASRLLLKAHAFADPGVRADLSRRFEAEGAARDRVELLGPLKGEDDHLALYGRADVALDTFPYHGTTTTFEALWMGLPVVTLAGDRHASRTGVSILTNLGRPRWIAATPDDYVRLAADLARDAEGLAALRRGPASLRAALRDSILCDGPSYATRLTDALREMWRDRCGRGAGNLRP